MNGKRSASPTEQEVAESAKAAFMADLADDEALEDELRQHIVEVEHRVEQAQEEGETCLFILLPVLCSNKFDRHTTPDRSRDNIKVLQHLKMAASPTLITTMKFVMQFTKKKRSWIVLKSGWQIILTI